MKLFEPQFRIIMAVDFSGNEWYYAQIKWWKSLWRWTTCYNGYHVWQLDDFNDAKRPTLLEAEKVLSKIKVDIARSKFKPKYKVLK